MLPAPGRADTARSGSGWTASAWAVAMMDMEALKHRYGGPGQNFFLHKVNFARGVAAGRDGGGGSPAGQVHQKRRIR